MKKRIALLLSFVLVLSLALCACGGGEENLTGKWTANVDLTDMMNEELTGDPEMADLAEYMTIDSFVLPFVLELREDGTYSMGIDEAGMNTAIDGVLADMKEGMLAYFADVLDVEEGVEEFLTSMGLDLDALMEEISAELVAEGTFDELTSEGKYKAKDGKLYLSDGLDYEPDPAGYNEYKLEGDTLTLDAGTESEEDYAEFLFPMVLTRVK